MGDLLITGSDIMGIDQLKRALHQTLTIKDLGMARYFLGIEITRSTTGTFLNQRKYVLNILSDAGLTAVKPAKFPLPKGLKLSIEKGVLLHDLEPYRRIIGKLLYLTLTRPDVSYVVQHLSQFLQHPMDLYYQRAMHVLRYLKGTPNKGLFYPKSTNFQVVAYTDADWGACQMSSRSLTGYCVFLGDALVSWKTKKQKTIAKSSVKAEYRAMSATTSELDWIAHLLQDLFLPLHLLVMMHCDNSSTAHSREPRLP